jgi:hypothetical protein
VTCPEDGEPEFQQFVDPLTGRPLPAPEPQARVEPDPTPAVDDPSTPGGLRRHPALLAVLAGTAVLLLAFFAFVTTPNSYPDRLGPVSQAGSDLPPPTVSPQPSAPMVPSVPGWLPVSSAEDRFSFDVPPDWTVEEPGSMIGFETPDGQLLAMHGVSRFETNFCPTLDVSARAQAGFTTIDTDEVTGDAEAARRTAIQWAEAAYSSPDGTTRPSISLSAVAPVRVLAGTVEAEQVIATIRPAGRNGCSPPSVSIIATALPISADPTVTAFHVHLILADQQVPDAIEPSVSAQIVASIRHTP